ncbi:MAG: metallophosphoesterase [Candidatus Poribacteria bacterium]
MKVWAIGDLHLSGANPKPMDKFGEQWKNHDEKISTAWRDTVAKDDLVVVAGDTSWAMKLQEAIVDLEWLAQLPGRKAFIRGNHDYWWSSLAKMRNIAPEGIEFIHNSAVRVNDVVVAGTRGWMLPVRSSAIYCASNDGDKSPYYERTAINRLTTNEVESGDWTENDEKILAREIGRLTLSLDAAKKLSDPNCTLLVAMHYPPIYADGTESPFTNLIEQYGPKIVVYGHLHVERQRNPDEVRGAVQSEGFEGQRGCTHYRLVSADYIGFQPVRIL